MTAESTQAGPRDGSEDAPILRLVTLILNEASREGATRVRLSREERRVLCEYEVGGVWREAESPPTYLWQQVGKVLVTYAGGEYWTKGARRGVISRPSLECRWWLACGDQHEQIILRALPEDATDEQSVSTSDAFVARRLSHLGLPPDAALLTHETVLLPTNRFFQAMAEAAEGGQREHPVLGNVLHLGEAVVVRSQFGSPMTAIQVENLRALGAGKVVHIGIAGSLSGDDLAIGDVVVSAGAFNETGTGVVYGFPFQQEIPADPELAREVHGRLLEAGVEAELCRHWVTDGARMETRSKIEQFAGLGARCVEMEAAGIFAVALKYGLSATSIYVISDVLADDEWAIGFDSDTLRAAVARVARFAVASF